MFQNTHTQETIANKEDILNYRCFKTPTHGKQLQTKNKFRIIDGVGFGWIIDVSKHTHTGNNYRQRRNPKL